MELNLEKVGINKYKVPQVPGMKVEAVVYANEAILKDLHQDLSLQQLQEAAMLPKLVSPVIGMPDIHEGFGLPIGGVMATQGLISVGAVGMDINCGVRLLVSNLSYDPSLFSRENLRIILQLIEKTIPVGVGGKRKEMPKGLELTKIATQGVKHLVEKGYALPEDLASIEENGCLKEAKFEALTPKAKQRAARQIGTLGSGNHFIEIQKVSEVFDDDLASKFNLQKDRICLMVHCGSRAMGHQTCVDYTDIFWEAKKKYGLEIPRKGLAALPIETREGRNYFAAMAASVNFAFSNRQMITYDLRRIMKRFFESKGIKTKLVLLYDVAHNIAKWEEYQGQKLLIHRKGATRALPAGHPQNPQKYRSSGHPAIVPGSMGTASYIMTGLDKNKETFFSINHGAGRVMSRKQAKKVIKKQDFDQAMKNVVYNKPFWVIADEAPDAYKNIHEVIDTLVEAGLTKKVAKLEPLAVVKGD
jgi:tRNA-splicing ligase RtcB